jgi:hypothetical protein
MPDIDLFNFYRWALGTVVTIYATLVTVQWAMGWYKYLRQPGRGTSMLSRYLQVAGLRMSLLRMSGDLLICVLLCVIFVMLCMVHGVVAQKGAGLTDAGRTPGHLHAPGV